LNTPELTPNGLKSENLPPRRQQSPQGKRHYWVWAVVVCVLALGIVLSLVRREAPAQASQGKRGFGPGVVPVATAVAQKGDIGIYTNGLGIVTPVYTVMVKSRVDGELMKVHYVEGQMVHKGDPLVEIDPRPYQAQVIQMEGQLKRDQALLENAKVDLERYKLAFASNAIPEQQLATQKATVQQYAGTVELDQGALSNAAVQLDYATITAPISGLVGLRMVDPGNIVHATDTTNLAVIVQLQPITVEFTVAEDILPEIQEQVRQGKKLTVYAYDKAITKRLATGMLQSMDSRIDVASGTIRLRASFPNEDNSLFPNQFVNALLLLRTEHDATLVPSVAVQRSAEGSFVYVVQPDQTAAMRAVTEGPTEGDVTSVTGVQAGETIVTDNFTRLQDGIKVAAHKAEGIPGQLVEASTGSAGDDPATGAAERGPGQLSGASPGGGRDKGAARTADEGPGKGRGKAGKARAKGPAAPHE